ncbi:MAG TPA: DUF5916 domain-containing protein [Pyrinomonadaceae bacterium]|nr:DUF5916 domain-containing protein [Pyrinomonadaceae bacterium]
MKRLVVAVAVLYLLSSVVTAQSNPPATSVPATPLPASSGARTEVGTVPAEVTNKSESSAAPGSATSKPAAGGPASALPGEKAHPVKVTLFSKPPVIDGKLDDDVWKTAAVFKDFRQWRPSDTGEASARTEMFAGYDSRFIYFGFHAYDDPAKVRATVAKRDSIFDDDSVGLLIDTFNDKRRAYELFFNPLGVQQDGFLTEGGNDDFSVDIVMESKGVLTDDGYTVEIAIPFKSLRYEAGKDKLWGIHILRQIKHVNGEQDSWMPISKDQSGLLSQAGHITGLEGISTERTLELIPSVTLSETGKRKAPVTVAQIANGGRFVNEPAKLDLGLTGKYSLTPQVTLDFAVNPDFAQVESDQLVVTANQRFPIFFEEKRPFFLEGIDIFRTQIAAVHTRAIIDPDYAAKLTGKVGRNTFGLLLASDNGPGNFNEDERTTANPRLLDKNASVGILRLKRDIGKQDSFIGFLGTYRRFVDTGNVLGGFDGKFRLDKVTTFSWQVLGTSSRRQFFYPDEGSTFDRREKGFIYALDYNQDGRHFGHEFSIVGRTRYYRADVGFNRRNNTNNPNWFIRYNSEPKPKAFLVSWRAYTDFSASFDWQGNSQNGNSENQIQFSFKKESFLGFGVDKGYERVFESEFGGTRQPGVDCIVTKDCTFAGSDNERSSSNHGLYMFAGSSPSKKYNFNFFVNRRWGDFDFDFGNDPKYPRVSPTAIVAAAFAAANPGTCDPAPPGAPPKVIPPQCKAPLDPGPGDFWHIDGSINYKPTTALTATLNFTKEKLTRYDTHRVAFDDNIVSLRTTYQFSRFLFARGRVDFDSIASSVKGQFLLGYTPNPGTAFYVGYNDDLNRHGFNPFTGSLEPGFRRNGRTFFIKASYLFRKSF